MASYCDFASGHPVHGDYHDTEYGFPTRDERTLFERLSLEIMQAGLSWETILKKRSGMNEAFHGFDVDRVARYRARDVKRLLGDPRIVRNRLKVAAIVHNAGRVEEMRGEGGFAAWLDSRHPMNRKSWTRLFKETFKFTGGEIVNEFLTSVGYLPGSHDPSCPVHARIAALDPPWRRADAAVFAEE